jgi:SPP1 family predicted phage head-tail adaptor
MNKDLASRLTKPIKIMYMADGVNDCLEKTKVPKVFCKTWGELLDKGARIVKQLNSTHPEITHVITIRYRPGILEEMWIIYKGRILDIETIINPMEKNEELKLHCKEKVIRNKNNG